MADKTKIVDRVRKLLALSQSPNQNEAETALLMAQRLMAEHRLDEGDLIEEGVPAEEVVEAGVYRSSRMPFWISRLANIIASNFRCELYYHAIDLNKIERDYRERDAWEREARFVGMDLDVAVAKEVFSKAVEFCNFFCDWALMEAKFEKGEVLSASERKQTDISFRAGFVNGLKKKFAEQIRENNWSLVLVVPGLVLHHMKKNHPDLKNRARSSAQVQRFDAYAEGQRRGGEFGEQHGKQKQKDIAPKQLKGNN